MKIRCDICGKFVSHKSLEDGTALRRLILPDSEETKETYQTLCPRCNCDRIRKEGQWVSLPWSGYDTPYFFKHINKVLKEISTAIKWEKEEK